MSWKKHAGKKVFEFLTPKPNVKIKGQDTIEKIKKKGKEFKKKIKSEESKKEFRKSGFYKYFTNQ